MLNFLKKKKKWIFSLLVLTVAGYYWLSRDTQSDVAEIKYSSVRVERGDIKVAISGSGQIYADSQVDIKPQVAGDGIDIIQVAVENNQTVKKGDLIAVLDTSDAQKSVRDAELSLRAAQLQMKETKKEYNSLNEDDTLKRDAQQVTVDQRWNSLNDAKSDLADYYIRAPFDGVITGLDVEPGDSVSRDEVLASVITEEMYGKISLNEIDASKVEIGDEAKLSFDAFPDLSLTGIVSKVDTIGAVSSGVVSYNVEIAFELPENSKLKPGMSVDAEIVMQEAQNVLILPVTAVNSSRSGGNMVVLVPEGFDLNVATPESIVGFEKKSVELGLTDDVFVEVKSGLTEGQYVLIKGAANSLNGGGFNGRGGFPVGGGMFGGRGFH